MQLKSQKRKKYFEQNSVLPRIVPILLHPLTVSHRFGGYSGWTEMHSSKLFSPGPQRVWTNHVWFSTTSSYDVQLHAACHLSSSGHVCMHPCTFWCSAVCALVRMYMYTRMYTCRHAMLATNMEQKPANLIKGYNINCQQWGQPCGYGLKSEM